MNVLYGVSGEGMGHVTIALEVTAYLQDRGHRVKVVTYGAGLNFLESLDVFPVMGLQAFYKDGKVDYLKSIFYNLRNFPKNFFKRQGIFKMVSEFAPDVCLTDDEPIVARIAYSKKIPLVSLSAVNSFAYSRENVPFTKRRSYWIAKLITKAITPRANKVLAISLTNKEYQKSGVIFLPPIIREPIQKVDRMKGKHVLVYFAKSNEDLIEKLKEIDENFMVYGVTGRKDEQNLKFRKPATFVQDLANCKAVISTAGFGLISEAIYLEKPLFVVPLIGHYEQYFNARHVKENGFGDFSERPSSEEIKIFLKNLGSYEKSFEKVEFDGKKTLKEISKSLEMFKSEGGKTI